MANSGPPKCKTCGKAEWSHICFPKGEEVDLQALIGEVPIFNREPPRPVSAPKAVVVSPKPQKDRPKAVAPAKMGRPRIVVDKVPKKRGRPPKPKPPVEEKKQKTPIFDRKTYQRNYMRKYRERQKEDSK